MKRSTEFPGAAWMCQVLRHTPSTDKASADFNTEHVIQEDSLFHWYFSKRNVRVGVCLFVCLFWRKWLPIYLRRTVWGGEEGCPGRRGRALLRRGCRGERHRGAHNKNEPAARRAAIQISMLLCKSLAIIVTLFQNTLLQLSAMYVKYTCACIYTQRYILQSVNFFWRRCTKSRLSPPKNLPSHINYNRHFKKGWQICFWMEVIHTHQKYQ